MKNYDVIVVGAGPAGLTVCRIAAESGLKVLLADQKKDIPRVTRACCANLIIEPGTHNETVTLAGGEMVFEHNRFSVPCRGSVIPLTENARVSPGGEILTINGKGPGGTVALSFEKEHLLQELFSQVQKTDAEVLTETQGVKAENTSDGVMVTLQDRNGRFTVKGKIAVAADGVNSRIVQSLGLNERKRKFFGRFAVTAYHVEKVECPYPKAWLTFVGKGHTSGGKGQLYLCPKPYKGAVEPTVYEITCGMPMVEQSGALTPKQELDYFLTEGPFAQWFRNMTIVDTRAAVLDFHTPLIDPVEGNVVVVGDAAAFIETYIQGAVMYGFQAARAIIKHVSTGTGLQDYAASWKESFEYNDPEEIKRATQAFGLHILSDEDLDYLFSLTKNDDIRGYLNEFTDPIVIMNSLANHIEQLQKERPDLAEILQKFGETSVEDALQVE